MNGRHAEQQAVRLSDGGSYGAYAVGVMQALCTGASSIGEVCAPIYQVERLKEGVYHA
jgi:hypothetical protein